MIGRAQLDSLLDHPPSALLEHHRDTIRHLEDDIQILKVRLKREREFLRVIEARRSRVAKKRRSR